MGILVGLFSLLAVAVGLVFKDRARVNGKCLLNVIYSVPTAMDYVGFGGAPTFLDGLSGRIRAGKRSSI